MTTKSDSNNGQKWITKKGNYSTSYPWHIVNVMSSKALDMAGNNAKVMPLQWTSENDYLGGQANVNQEWKFEEVDATNHTYKIYAYTQNKTYYLTYDGTDGGKLGRTTDSNSATAFGFISTDGTAGGGTTSGGGTGSGGSTTSPNHGSFSVSWIKDPSKVSDYKEDAHATFIPYASVEQMKADTKHYAEPWQQPDEKRLNISTSTELGSSSMLQVNHLGFQLLLVKANSRQRTITTATGTTSACRSLGKWQTTASRYIPT